MTLKTLCIAVALVVGLPQMALAHGDEKHEPTMAAMSADEMLAAVKTKLTAIEQALAAKDLKGIHQLSEDAAASAAMLRDHVTPPPDKKQRFDSAAKQLVEQLQAVHAAADKGDQVATESAFKKAQGAAKLVEANMK